MFLFLHFRLSIHIWRLKNIGGLTFCFCNISALQETGAPIVQEGGHRF